MIILLEEETVKTYHDVAIEVYGGLPGICPDKSLESCLERVHNHLIYGELLDVYEAAALYAEAIARGHIFVDGNKRTAYYSMLYFFKINHINEELFSPTYNQIVEYMVNLADKKLDYRQFSKILREWQDQRSPLAKAITQFLISESPSSTN